MMTLVQPVVPARGYAAEFGPEDRRITRRALELAVVIPVLNERGNVRPMLDRLNVTLAGLQHEIVFVDDGSTDDTTAEIEAIARYDRRVRLVRRYGRRGLSSAVIEGMCASVARVVAVIDGDLQHDETILPRMLEAILEEGHEMAIGTRYADGGSVGDWDRGRVSISRFATRLAAPIMKTPISDPMSGFFAIRRDVLLEIVPRLSTVGYKLLLDIVASAPRRLDAVEIPYRFRTRTSGESKLDTAVVLEYFELLLEKMIGRWIPPKLILFGAIGAAGAVVQLAVLGLAHKIAGVGFAYAEIVAVGMAMLFNYTLNNILTYRDRRLTGLRWVKGLISFMLVCSFGAIANVGIGTVLYGQHGERWWLAGLLGIAVGSVWNYVATKWLTWRSR